MTARCSNPFALWIVERCSRFCFEASAQSLQCFYVLSDLSQVLKSAYEPEKPFYLPGVDDETPLLDDCPRYSCHLLRFAFSQQLNLSKSCKRRFIPFSVSAFVIACSIASSNGVSLSSFASEHISLDERLPR